MYAAQVALIVCCSSTLTSSELELVPNGSFEEATGCPVTNGQIYLAAPWISPTTGTTDYMNPCNPDPLSVSVPINAVGTQPTYEGSSYAGFIAIGAAKIDPDYREYLQVPLSTSLDADATYRFSMHLSLAEDASTATDRIGAYFSTTAPSAGDSDPLPFTPQLETPAGTFLSDYLEWTDFEDTFVAVGGEQYLTIGNFHDAASSATIAAGLGPDAPLQIGTGYYYIDDVSLLCEPCLHPPDDMCAWWTLDETSGSIAYDIVLAQHGLHVSGPTPTPGYIGGGLSFLGSGVIIPTSWELELLHPLGFSFDFWVRPDALGTTQTLLAKIPSIDPFTGPGYGLVMNADGTLTFSMVDAGLSSATGDSSVALAAGVWSHVIVAVDRDDPLGGKIYIDGTDATFDPTTAPGSLANALPLRFAQDGGAGLGSDLTGSMDEVSLYCRSLFDYEIEAVFQARTSGKCKIFLELTPVTGTPITPGTGPTITTSGNLTNGSGTTGTFTVSVRGDPAGTRCGLLSSTVDGPSNPLVLTPSPIQVPAGATVPIEFELDIPPKLLRGVACYTVTTTHVETTRTFVSRGAIRRDAVRRSFRPR